MDDAGDEVGELGGGFPFSKTIGGQDVAGLDGDLAEAGDEKLAGDDEGGDPDRAEACEGHEDEAGADEDFIGEGIEEFAEGGDEVELAGEPAIEVIADGGGDEEEKGDEVAPGAVE